MESMERIDVLKGIEQILVQKAYETGHISHRADGDWQKQADGSWTPYTGQSTQSTSQAQEPAPTEFSDLNKYIAKLPNTDLAEDSDEVTNVVAEYLADHGIDDNDDDFLAVRNAIMEKLGGDRYGEITEEDLVETEDFSPEEYNDFKSEIESLASGEFFNDVANIRVDPNNSDMPDNDDLLDVTDKLIEQFDLSKNLTDEQYEDLTEVVQDIWSQNNPTVDEEDSDDWSKDWEIDPENKWSEEYHSSNSTLPHMTNSLALQKVGVQQYNKFANDLFEFANRSQGSTADNPSKNYSKGVAGLKKFISDHPIPDLGNQEKQAKFYKDMVRFFESMGYQGAEGAYEWLESHPAKLGQDFKKYIKDFVGKSYRDMRSAPATKNMGF